MINETDVPNNPVPAQEETKYQKFRVIVLTKLWDAMLVALFILGISVAGTLAVVIPILALKSITRFVCN